MRTEKKEVIKAAIPLFLLITGMATAGLFILLFSEIAEELLEKEIKAFDTAVASFVQSTESQTMDSFMVFITELGSVWFLALLSILTVLYLWYKRKDKWGIVFFILAVGGGGLLTKLLKYYYERTRPSLNPAIDAVGFSFPSGHAMGSLIFYGFIIYLVIRSGLSIPFKGVFTILPACLFIMIGISRIYLQAHYPSDVIAGFLAGAVWLIVCITAREWIAWRTNNHIHPMRVMRDYFTNFFH